MVFFDLNVPYLDKDGAATSAAQESAAAACKAARLRVVVKAMELGYSGVAYNRSIRGLVSDLDRCKIIPFDLSSLLSVAPGLAAAARFHREVLGVSISGSFRQYTRLTVAVDSPQGAAALSSGSAVLRSYHLVAVRPLNQIAFDQICKVSDVDLIAVDFSQKLPFRLKLPMIKAAIERGIYFEITYSHLISDVHVRRQMLMDAKVLVDLTRGKNLIFSSGASCVNDIRGPYDVINLFSLLGFSMEKAKIALSKNCSCLINSALRRKQCYDGAIRIEKCLTRAQVNSKDGFPDWTHWDRISSGDGDLPALDDIVRVLSSSGGASQSCSTVQEETTLQEMILDGISPIKGENLMRFDDMGENFSVTDEHKHLTAENGNPNFSVEEVDDISAEDKKLSSDRDDFESISGASSPRAGDLIDVGGTLFETECSGYGFEKESFPETDSSFCPVKDDRELQNAESLERDESAKSGPLAGVDSLSLPESISSIEVSVVDSAPSRDISVNIEGQNRKRGRVQQLPPRGFLFTSKHCIRRLLFKRGARRHSVRRK